VNFPRALGLALSFAVASADPAFAAWPVSPFTNLPVCTAAGDQLSPSIVSDGAGGAIMCWYDFRNGSDWDIYAQHLLVGGATDPGWPANGRAVCTATGTQASPTLTSDGAGGAIVTWYDLRSGGYDIYAQHVLGTGAVDPAWPANGRALCVAANTQNGPVLVPDGAGGAIVAWNDARSGTADVYAQHVLATGLVDPAWPLDGRQLCNAAHEHQGPSIVSDGAGGGIVCWYDFRNGVDWDIYGQRLLATGSLDPAWPTDGRALCTAAGNQISVTTVSDGAGGAIAAWQDIRNGTDYDVYAHHLLASGAVDPSWDVNGRAISQAANYQQNVSIDTDGAGGAVIAWQDSRSGLAYIYAQHLRANGFVDSAWPASGLGLTTAAGDQTFPKVSADGSGGAFVVWQDFGAALLYDIYGQHVTATGGVATGWPANGLGICTATGNQSAPCLLADGSGSAIVAWNDRRSGGFDTYAQRIGRYGYLGTPEAEITSVRDVPNDQGGVVKVSWNASYLEADPYAVVTQYKVFRSVPPNTLAARLAAGDRVSRADASGETTLDRPGDLLVTSVAGTSYYWEFVAAMNADYLTRYSYLVPTAGDSVAAGPPSTAFMVQARSAGTLHWESEAATGYSVDNLAPLAPSPLTGQYAAGSVALHWEPNAEPDLESYRIYRGATASFTPGPASFLVAVADTGHVDAAGAPYYYKVTAVDTHGNESAASTVLPANTLAVGPPDASRELSFALPSPNPALTQVTLRFTVPAATRVRLTVQDAAGRMVRELSNAARGPGAHAESWDLRDARGQTVGAGVYFARLQAQGRTLVRRVIVVP
jgi:hypothetical protein